jgi:hypothetical protein
MSKKPGRGGGPRKSRRGGGGAPNKGGGGPGKRGRGPAGRGQRPTKSDYFMQPGKRGVFVVLRRPIGNRAHAKECGTMPSRVHAKMLIDSLQRAESVVKDLFMEATDDGIEALEAILAATREDVLRRGPRVQVRAETASDSADDAPESEESPSPEEDDEDPYADDEDDEPTA